MQILAIVGSLGAGKSSLVENTIRQAVQTGLLETNRAAYLLNDRPSQDGRMVDGHSIREVARVIPFPNRCFTCEDSENLQRQLRVLSESGEIDLVVLEGYGFVAGAEMTEALQGTGYPFHIFTLVDAKHLVENRAAYGEVIESQIASATLGIGVTHVVNGKLDAVLELVKTSVKAGVPTMAIPKGHGIPPRLFTHLFSSSEPKGSDMICGCGHVHLGHDHSHHQGNHHHGHNHDHPHAHHDFFSVTYPLREGVTLEDLQDLLRDSDVIRGKGIVSGVRFDLSHDVWSRGDPSNQPGIVTLYSRGGEIRIPDQLIDPEARSSHLGSTKLLLRQNVDAKAAKAALERLTKSIPVEAVVLPGTDGLRVAVQLEELQLLKNIAQRPSVKDEWLVKAIGVALRYWVSCAKFIEINKSKMDMAELPVSCLELGLSLGWWTNRFENQLESALVQEVSDCKVGTLLATGMVGYWLHSQPERAIAQAEYYRDVMLFVVRHENLPEDATEKLLSSVFDNASAAVKDRSLSVQMAWMQAKSALSA